MEKNLYIFKQDFLKEEGKYGEKAYIYIEIKFYAFLSLGLYNFCQVSPRILQDHCV